MTTVIRCGRLFTGTGAEPIERAEIIVEGPAPEGAEIVDLSQYFVLPGLIDAHTHLSVNPSRGDQLGQLRQPPGKQALRVPDNMRKDLLAVEGDPLADPAALDRVVFVMKGGVRV